MIPGIVASVTVHNKNNNQITTTGEILNIHRNSVKAQRVVVNDTNLNLISKDTASSNLLLIFS